MRRHKAIEFGCRKANRHSTPAALPLPDVRLGRRPDRHGVGNVLLEEIELDLGTHGIVDKHLVACVFDVLFLEIDAELLQMLAELDRARSLECDVVYAATMLVLYDRALRKPRADVDDGVVAVIEPDATELEIWTVTRLQAEHIAVELLDGGNILQRAPDVEMQETLEFHGCPPGQWPSLLPKILPQKTQLQRTRKDKLTELQGRTRVSKTTSGA